MNKEILLQLLGYGRTNEDLKAITSGLNVGPQDSILAIGGSGDQALALLEFADKVKVVDYNQEQVNHIKGRVEMLQARDYESFLAPPKLEEHPEIFVGQHMRQEIKTYFERTARYFRQGLRLDIIRERLSHLSISEPQNILNLEDQELFTKIYLSNILDYFVFSESYGKNGAALDNLMKCLTPSGLVYITNHNILRSFPHLLSNQLQPDRELSSLARKFETGWKPGVYRKVNS